ncbi:hypothetical protein LTR10_015756 [Elasticomyces elasticus]|uniref:FAD-binding domain-containing protein n=1 Tax=Exophiala sideris TaxID=1016849 RepID=A0ABR0IYE2_9EURO|nr:hypothetical protein LTR10_015756 [Elasticomyces elasticus]KAK5022572.1 hypothetical protein LTS07_010018 [Exophiala sideris]KAK5028100.1 hypothetical protein LTR13_009329 [Exophiala sideris]KAK5051841.1 hypothetical protein LTR69_010132 [Exophiala sideris]KAK5177827.1 hypothetical protein LTR44_009592 [Eurotiomycetes sp. CCFEE 6388]
MLRIAIAGAGVTGLLAAIGFARYGHQVTIYERKTETVFANEGGAGIQLQANAMRILRAWNLDIQDVAHDSNGVAVRRYATGESIAVIKPVAGTQMFMLRSDFRRSMLKHALAADVQVLFNQDITGVDASRPALLLKGGVEIEADLIIGADGIRSKVRNVLFPTVEPEVRAECTFQFQVPFSELKSDAVKEIISSPNANLFLRPDTTIVASPIFSRDIFDLQFITQRYGWETDPHPDLWNEYIPDMTDIRNRYRMYGPVIQELLGLSKGVWKWRHAECFSPSWTSDNGKVILAGDACHAMVPFAGHGAGMCIEDAAVLATMFRDIDPRDHSGIRTCAKLYQDLRQPRTDRCHQRALAMAVTYGLPDGKVQQKRDTALGRVMGKKVHLPVRGDSDAHPLSNEFENWLEQYNALEEARNTLRAAGLAEPTAKL